MTRKLTTLAIVVILAITALTVSKPCPTEDSYNCTYNAQTRGNGAGLSFVNIEGLVIYAPVYYGK